jgi:hypothetical protein
MSVTVHEQQTAISEEAALDRELAATFMSDDASKRWLTAANPILNGEAPIDCLKRREYDRVRAALEAFNTGVYV